jgi:hypothetical protein
MHKVGSYLASFEKTALRGRCLGVVASAKRCRVMMVNKVVDEKRIIVKKVDQEENNLVASPPQCT